ncbi:peptidoglycan recognition protein family protein [Spirulina sp. CS-785/01]|uniref:peptidoglycan recognition protein family protein n=1 Tax=Spirulina sp. CS-785/01 TaxID=3021716 RepID=UPI00232FD6FC|nr:peptidoglycan recognition family protein [Spirulina sp. CS-785/01]
MAWLKLTQKALYLMQGGTNQYLQKVDLQPHNPEREQYRFNVPVDWFQSLNNPPQSMIVSLEEGEPQPVTPETPLASTLDRVITTQEWNAEPPREDFERTIPKYIVIHHSAHRNPPHAVSEGTEEGAKELARSIQKDHLYGRNWSDSGHNFLNTTGGYLLEGRQGSLEAVMEGKSVRSAHAKQDDALLSGGNSSPGIENEGNFMSFEMVETQWNSLVELCAAICHACNITADNIRGHRDFSNTQCPGDWLYNQLPRLRQAVRERLMIAKD